jgi:hypothetical protein
LQHLSSIDLPGSRLGASDPLWGTVGLQTFFFIRSQQKMLHLTCCCRQVGPTRQRHVLATLLSNSTPSKRGIHTVHFKTQPFKMAFAPESGPIKRMPLTALCSCPPRERTDFQIPNLRLPPTLFQNISNLYPPPFASFPHLSSPVILASERRTTGSLSRRQVRRLHQAASSGGEVSSIHSTISWDRICFELRRCHLPVR